MGRMIEQRPIDYLKTKENTIQVTFSVMKGDLEKYVFGLAQNEGYIMIEKRP